MLGIKETLAKILYKLSVIPSDDYATATKTSSSAWTGGSIRAWRKGNCCTVKFDGVAHPKITSRTTIGTLPEGFRPPVELEVLMTNVNSSGGVTAATKFLVEPNGEVKIDPTSAGSTWATLTYCVGGVARRLLTKLISERRWATC